jgi:ATP-dependent DNA helicase PIF1
MNNEQVAFIDLAKKGHNIFLTGQGGTGKSFVLSHFMNEVKTKTVALTAMTGCAALLLADNGIKATTLHSWASVGLAKDPVPKLISSIRKSSRSMKRWLLTDILIVDEVSMMPPDFFEKLDAIGKKIRNSHKPFGGIQLIFVGDFYQLPPVSRESSTIEFIFETALWPTVGFKTVVLKEIMRQKDPVFHKILSEARIGQLSEESVEILKLRKDLPWKKLEIKPTLLFPQRSVVADINAQNLAKLVGPEYKYKVATIYSHSQDPDNLGLKYAIEKMNRDASYEEELVLKVGAQVMLLINIIRKGEASDLEHDLVNGSRGLVTGFLDDSVKTPLVKFQNFNNPIPISAHAWSIDDYEGVSQYQIPLKLAYAITIHKAQGATLDSALIDVGSNTFERGQAYVALSRVKSLDSLYIWNISSDAFKANPRVKKLYESL